MHVYIYIYCISMYGYYLCMGIIYVWVVTHKGYTTTRAVFMSGLLHLGASFLGVYCAHIPTYPLRDLKSFRSVSVGGLGMTLPLLLDTRTLVPSSRYLNVTLQGLLCMQHIQLAITTRAHRVKTVITQVKCMHFV